MSEKETPAPSTQTVGPDGLNEHAFDAARKAYHQTHIGDYGPLRAAIAAYGSALEESFDAERDSLTREIEEYRSEMRAVGRLDYKIVPLVPTREMIDAWRLDQAQGRSLESSYAAMIDASPSPQTREVGRQ